MALTEISLTQESGAVCQIFTKGHIITADDPVDPKSDDEGPTPLEYLLSAVGSSAAIALRRAAERLGVPIEEIQASVRYRTTHHRLLDEGETLPEAPMQREMRIRVSRDISGVERDQLLAAIKASPLDRILNVTPKIEDALYVFGYANPDEGVVVD